MDLEHHPFEAAALLAFMRGVVDGGPIRSGHRTPAVIVTLPLDGSDERALRTNSWMIVAWACGALLLLPPGYFRAFHFAHHRHTRIRRAIRSWHHQSRLRLAPISGMYRACVLARAHRGHGPPRVREG